MKKTPIILLLAGLFLLQCSWGPKSQSQTEIETSSTLDSINLYYNENLSEERFGTIAPKHYICVGNHRKMSISLPSATHTDSVLTADLIALIESSKQSDTIKVVSRERWEPCTIQLNATSSFDAIIYHFVDGVDAYYVIESVYSSGKRDTITLGRFAFKGIYHSEQSYISEDNGLYAGLRDFLKTKDPDWAELNDFYLR